MLKNEIHKKIADKVIEQMKIHGTDWAEICEAMATITDDL